MRMPPFLVLAALTAASPATAQEAVHSADGYTVYWEEPGYCTMYLDTSTRSMLRFSRRASDGAVNVSWVHPDFPQSQTSQTMAASFAFDGAKMWRTLATQGYTSGDGRWGFASLADDLFLERWASGKTVDVSLNLENPKPLERIALRGSAAAVNRLKTCSDPQFTPSVPPAPPDPNESPEPEIEASDVSAAGRVRIACKGETATVYVGAQRVGAAPADCLTSPGVVRSRSFPTGEQLFLIMGGSHMANQGIALYVRKGAPPRMIAVDYLTEFGEILAPNRFVTVSTGQQEMGCGAASWTTEIIVDWNRAKVTGSRELSRDRGC